MDSNPRLPQVSLTRISEALSQWMKNETGDDPPEETPQPLHDDLALAEGGVG